MLIVTACLLMGGVAILTRHHEDQHLNELNAAFGHRPGRLIVKAKLLRDDDFNQTDTPFIDVSMESDLIVALLFPAKAAYPWGGKYRELCQISLAEGERSEPTLIHILWMGKGDLRFFLLETSTRM